MADIFLTREQSRAIDSIAIARYGIPGMVLMENAGRGVVDVLLSLDPSLTSVATERPVPAISILCGKGNNAGDGFVIARHLLIQGAQAKVILLSPPDQLQGDALLNYQILCHTEVPLLDLSSGADLEARLDVEAANAEWLVDAMLGTGACGTPREPFRSAIEWLNDQSGNRLAVDVPSGLDCDTGEPFQLAVRADHTCMMAAAKKGLVQPHAAPYAGRLHVISIGIPPQLVTEVHELRFLP